MRSLVGKRFGHQVVLRELGGGKVEIRCDCGKVKTTAKQYLVNGESRSCGCGRYADIAPPIRVGDVFDLLVVKQKLGSTGVQRQVLCLCACGSYVVVREGSLRDGTTKSCGCFRRARAGNLNRRHGESGQRRTALYNTWMGMIDRVRRRPDYAMRGIDPAWEKSFETFRDYINERLGPRPKGHSLDRIDNECGYEPGNVKWSSAKEQMRNRRSNVVVTVNGVTRCLADWAEATGVSQQVISGRIRRGWTPERAVTEPLQGHRHLN